MAHYTFASFYEKICCPHTDAKFCHLHNGQKNLTNQKTMYNKIHIRIYLVTFTISLQFSAVWAVQDVLIWTTKCFRKVWVTQCIFPSIPVSAKWAQLITHSVELSQLSIHTLQQITLSFSTELNKLDRTLMINSGQRSQRKVHTAFYNAGTVSVARIKPVCSTKLI